MNAPHRTGRFTRGPIESDDNMLRSTHRFLDLLTVFQKIAARHIEEIKMEIHREEISLADMIKSLSEGF